MRHIFRKSRVAAIVGVVAVVSAATMALVAPSAFGDSASDTRADFHGGNATNCGSGKNGINVGGTLAFASGTSPITTGPVQGTVVDGTTVNVTNPGNVTILAVVVKGGNGYNVYSTLSGVGVDRGNHVPPAEPLPTEYISPLNNGGNIPTVSHWFVCYTGGEQPTTGSLAVTKEVSGGTGIVVPTTFHITVDCTDNTADTSFDIVDQQTIVVNNIANGATCTVTETGVDEFPLLATVTIEATTPVIPGAPVFVGGGVAPSTVSGTAVPITGGLQSEVTVTNTFPDVAGEQVVRTVVTDPVVVSPAFTG